MRKAGTILLALAVMGLMLVALVPHAALANHETNTTDDDETNDDADDEDSGTESTADNTARGESGDYFARLSSRDNDTEEDGNSSTTTRTTTTARTRNSTTASSSLGDDEDDMRSGGEGRGTTGPIATAGSSPDAVAPVELEGVPTFFVILLDDNEVRPATDREVDVMVDMLDSGESLLENSVGDMEESATRPVSDSVLERMGDDEGRGTADSGSVGTAAGDSVDDGSGAVGDDEDDSTLGMDDGTSTDGSGTSGTLVS